VSKAKQKGTSAETALVRYLQGQGFPGAERRALGGGGAGEDLGDITGTPCLAWEVKNHASYKIPAWLRETQIETENAKADFGILAVKPNGVGLSNAGNWWAIMSMAEMVRLLREAGYGDPIA
jgi:Holliday junction resolvase